MYISTLPLYAQCLLEKELDWDNEGVDKDLNEIADKMIHWEEKGLHTLLELSHIEIHDIEVTYKYKDNPILKRYSAFYLSGHFFSFLESDEHIHPKDEN